MGVDYSRIRSLTAREVIAALIRDGFYFIRQRHGRAACGRGHRLWTENDLIRLGIAKKGQAARVSCFAPTAAFSRAGVQSSAGGRVDHAGVCERLIVQDRKRLGEAGAFAQSIDFTVAHAEAPLKRAAVSFEARSKSGELKLAAAR